MSGEMKPLEVSVLHMGGVSKSFRGKPALHDVEFRVPASSLTVILGPAGAGKTTTLRMIAGLDKPDAGVVSLNGQDVSGWEPRDRNIAMIFDNLALYPDKTGFENIASPLVIRGESKQAIKEKVAEMAAKLKVSHTLDRLPKTMSGGERQRIALGRALIRTPVLFLLDEPLSSLDAMLRIELRAELKRLQRECGCTFLMATPDYTEALAIADTVVMLRKGSVVQIDAPQTLYDLPVDREVAQFVGAPQINLIGARIDTLGHGVIMAADAVLPLPEHLQAVLSGSGHDFELGIRPENLALAANETDAPIRAQVVDVEALGVKSVLTVRNDTAELRLVVESVRTLGMRAGQTVGVEVVNPSTLLAFDLATGRRITA